MPYESPPSVLDRAPPKPWRRLLPRWLRSLVWLDSAARYDAFLSYSWKADSKIAPVIHSLLQRFLCPWYKLRAKAIFRDLSSLPAGSSLESELFERLDRSQHLIVLACPAAAASAGMQLEAAHWFSRPRAGEVLIIVTDGVAKSWGEIREWLLPAALRANLTDEPLWIPLQHRRAEIESEPESQKLRGALIEELKQIFLQLYKPRTWEELHGEERAQRRRALRAVAAVVVVVFGLAVGMFVFWRNAERNHEIAVARQLTVRSQLLQAQQPEMLERSLLLAVESLSRFQKLGVPSLEADQAVRQALEVFPRTMSKMSLPSWRYDKPGTFLTGGQIYVANDQRQLIFLDLLSGKEKTRIDRGKPLTGLVRQPLLAVSQDATRLAYEVPDAFVIVDTATFREISRIFVGYVADLLALSPDGKYLAAAYGGKGAVAVHETEGGALVTKFENGWGVHALSFNRTGAYLVSSGRQNRSGPKNDVYGWASVRQIGTWKEVANVADGELLPLFKLSPDGETAAFTKTGSNFGTLDRGIRIVDLSTLAIKARLPHGSDISAMDYDRTGRYLATGAWHGVARIWDVTESREVHRFPETGIVTHVIFAADGRYVATVGTDSRTAHVWEFDGGREVGRVVLDAPIAAVSFIDGGAAQIALIDSKGGAATVSITGRDGGRWSYPSEVQAVSVAPDGSKLAYQTDDNSVHVARIDGANIVALPYGAAARTKRYHASSAARLRFSGDANRVAATAAWGGDAAVKIWSLGKLGQQWTVSEIARSNELDIPSLGEDYETVRSVALDRLGTNVAIATAAGAQVNDVASGSRVFDLPHKGGYVDVAYSLDGALLAACARDGDLGVWRIAASRERHPQAKLHAAHKPGCKRLGISPDASLLAIAEPSHNVTIVDISSGSARAVLPHDSEVSDVSFSADGRYVATAAIDGFVRVWVARTGAQVSQFEQRGYVQAVAFDAADAYVVAADGYVVRAPGSTPAYEKNYARRWLWKPDDLVNEACARVGRNLTRGEWADYVGDGKCRAVCPKVGAVCNAP